ncbi:MAG: hypothetical protein EXR98_03290 [Gemmataceae bacterium]|nr:hypothetical protein [Gemmataceae bacterium]
MPISQKRIGLLLALGFALLPIVGGRAGDKKPAEKNEYFNGNVVLLSEALAKQGVKIDPDQYVLVLQTDDGKLYPLVKDEGARMFFKDAKLLNRPMRLTARLVPKTQFLQVINVHSIVKGRLHDVYYWCDICTIKRYQAGICDCCLAPMELREVPYKGE